VVTITTHHATSCDLCAPFHHQSIVVVSGGVLLCRCWQAELAEVRETLELDAAAAATSSTTKKRATSGSTAGVKRKAPAKAARAAGGGGDGDEDEGEEAQPDAGIDWAGHVAAGTVNTRAITLDMMKAYCRRNGLQVGGTKAVLAERITNHFASAAAGGGGGGEPPAKRRRKE